jgi:hypothetical protein
MSALAHIAQTLDWTILQSQWSVWMEFPRWAVLWMEAMDRHYERLSGIIVPPHELIHECTRAHCTDIGLELSLLVIPLEKDDVMQVGRQSMATPRFGVF